MKKEITPNSIGAWMLAVRPKTLSASVVPVLVAAAFALRDGVFQWIPTLAALLFAILAQIASNIANDYFDFKKGADREDRLGPQKAAANGLLPPKSLLYAAIFSLALACLFGSILLFYGGPWMLLVGFLVCVCALAYTTGPFPLSYLGLGDLFVLIFYGIVPVCFTYYVQAGCFTMPVFIASVALGLVAINILVVNNYRDVEADNISGKRTTIVRFGKSFGRAFYLFNGVAPLMLCQLYWVYGMRGAAMLPLLFIPSLRDAYLRLKVYEGKELNEVLFQSAKNVLIFGVLLAIGCFIN